MLNFSQRAGYDDIVYYDEKRKRWRGEVKYNKLGEVVRKGFSGKTQSEVISKMEQYKIDIYKNGQLLIYDAISFEDYALGWMENIQINKIKTSSYYTKLRTLKNLVFPYIGKIPMQNLSFTDVQNNITLLVKKGLSYSSIKKAYEVINSCTKYYRVEKQINYNPCEGVELPKNLEKDISNYKYLNRKERELLEKEAYKVYGNGSLMYKNGPAIVFLMYTGLRFAELSGLTWEDVDFERREISINKSSVYIDMDGEHKFIDQDSLKTKCSYRLLPMTEKAFKALEKMKEVMGEDGYVLTTKNGNHVTPANINKTFRRMLANAGIIKKGEFKGVHILRHTFATMLFENGCEVKIVSELLGHSSTKITENIYIHTIQQQKIKAIASLDKYCC